MNPNSIINQLEHIIHILNSGSTTPEQIEILQEFILKFNFTKFNKNNSEKDLIKYLSIGWYICENINNL